MKTRIFALAVALAMPMTAQAATFDVTNSNSMFIGGTISGIEQIGIRMWVDAVPGPPIPDPGYPPAPQYLATYWTGGLLAKTALSGWQVAEFGMCYTYCSYFPHSGLGTSFTLNISELAAERTISWQALISSQGGNMISVTPHVTLSMRDGLAPVPTPLPAALPLFAAGLGMVTFIARRRSRHQPPRHLAHAVDA